MKTCGIHDEAAFRMTKIQASKVRDCHGEHTCTDHDHPVDECPIVIASEYADMIVELMGCESCRKMLPMFMTPATTDPELAGAVIWALAISAAESDAQISKGMDNWYNLPDEAAEVMRASLGVEYTVPDA